VYATTANGRPSVWICALGLVKRDGTIGYVSSRYLSPQPVKVAKRIKNKPKKAKHRKATQPPALDKTKPGEEKPAPPTEPESQEYPKAM
jgi:hypothetical protein